MGQSRFIHSYMTNWWFPGCSIGYEHTFINALADFLLGLERNKKICPDFADAQRTQIICDAVLRSARDRSWEDIKV